MQGKVKHQLKRSPFQCLDELSKFDEAFCHEKVRAHQHEVLSFCLPLIFQNLLPVHAHYLDCHAPRVWFNVRAWWIAHVGESNPGRIHLWRRKNSNSDLLRKIGRYDELRPNEPMLFRM